MKTASVKISVLKTMRLRCGYIFFPLLVLCFLAFPSKSGATQITWESTAASVTFPAAEQIFWVSPSNPWKTITATGTSLSQYTYIAGEDGETFTHVWSINLDSKTVGDSDSYSVPPWENATAWFELTAEQLSVTDTVGLGPHTVFVEHRVSMSNSIIISTAEVNPITFYVYPTPEPATLLLIASGLIGLSGFRRNMRRKSKGKVHE